MQAKTISYKNSSLSYRVTGKGNTVVLLHGFAEDSRIWDEIIQHLSSGYQLIIPDIPGSGLSALPDGNDTDIAGYADAIAAVLEKEGIDQCTMIGHSMGGYITLAFAKKYPEKIQAIGLFHSSAYTDDEAKKETRKKAIRVIEEKGAMAFLKTSIPGLFANPEKSKADIDTLLQRAESFTAAALIQYYEAMIVRPDTTAVLKNLQAPVLFILGEHDKAVPFEHGLQQSYLPAISHINILRNSAHMGMLEEKEKSFAILADFLQAVYV